MLPKTIVASGPLVFLYLPKANSYNPRMRGVFTGFLQANDGIDLQVNCWKLASKFQGVLDQSIS